MILAFLIFAVTLQSLQLPAAIPAKSDRYQMDSQVTGAAEPGFLKFKVTAKHAVYEVETIPALQKLLHEIDVIETVTTEGGGTGFMDGAADSVEATGEGFVKLVSHPVQSGKGIGRAAGKLGGKIGGMFRSKEEAEKSSFGEKITGSSKREIAKEYGIDVYSTNPHLQNLLGGMAKARAGGKGAAVIAKFLLPVAGLVSVALTASGINGAADQLVNDNSRQDLYKLNKKSLEEMGYEEDEVKNFLNLPHYTPREVTYIRFYLEALKNVKDSHEIFKTAERAGSLWAAKKILYSSQIAAGMLETVKNMEALEITEEGLAVKAGTQVFFITPYDYLDHSPLTDRIVKSASAYKAKWSAESVELVNAGKVTLALSASLLLKGIKAKSWTLFTQQPPA